MKKALFAVLALALVAGTALVPAPAQAQQQQAPAPPQSWDEAALRSFNNIHNKLIAMAKDPKFPADKENYKPHPESRSFNEELAHVIAPLVSSACNATRSAPGSGWRHRGMPPSLASAWAIPSRYRRTPSETRPFPPVRTTIASATGRRFR